VLDDEGSPLRAGRAVLYVLTGLLASLLIWAVVGRLDIVAVASGKLVPRTYVQIVQPAEAGIVREILVKEGEDVGKGQVLMRMDRQISDSDRHLIANELRLRELQLRRIDAELSGAPLRRRADDPSELYGEVEAQYLARVRAFQDILAGERLTLEKIRADLAAAREIETKLRKTNPIFRAQAEGWEKLAREGFAGRLLALERQRSFIESEQDIRAQAHAIEGLNALATQSQQRLVQIASTYRQGLQQERGEVASQHRKLEQDREKHQHRHDLHELRAPHTGKIKDLATHTVGTVVAPGTILLTLVSNDQPLLAEVWLPNADAGFIYKNQVVKIKVAAYPFQRYGLAQGVVHHIGADATGRNDMIDPVKQSGGPLFYRVLVALSASELDGLGGRYRLLPGMQVTAEIHVGERSVLNYLLSPIQKVISEAGRER